MMDLIKLKEIPNQRISQSRSILRILESEYFENAFSKASEEDKKKLFVLIFNEDKTSLLSWIKKIIKTKAMNIYELQNEAYRLGVKNPSRLSKSQLQWEIESRNV